METVQNDVQLQLSIQNLQKTVKTLPRTSPRCFQKVPRGLQETPKWPFLDSLVLLGSTYKPLGAILMPINHQYTTQAALDSIYNINIDDIVNVIDIIGIVDIHNYAWQIYRIIDL